MPRASSRTNAIYIPTNCSCSLISAMMAQCKGTTARGQQCKITATSNLLDDRGRLVGAPLAFGAPCCSLHGRPFSARPVIPDGQLVAFCIDFEATGVTPTFDRVVELAATVCVLATVHGVCHDSVNSHVWRFIIIEVRRQSVSCMSHHACNACI